MAGVLSANLPTVATLLAAGAKPNTTEPETGNTALMLAANRDLPVIVDLLLKSGADPRIKARDGWTALAASRMIEANEVTALIENALKKALEQKP